ncbi:hypothetical protein L207DRAFT_513999 [Hyaloscypha variabilis F]|jgi:hypothetical protein|uniref:Uncharacterized protein n=1 Tax=Hyaloscypha variabilis (strain UAMH 11265 / GT02V1 / F) TaxID=1149755 RepID=A0A2J6RHT4_HYAVF|nr:hypothetical protein L207DRAFT_513999 [Hyaloscypha variabilis F]
MVGVGSGSCLLAGVAIGRDFGGIEGLAGGFAAAAAAARCPAHNFFAPETTGAGAGAGTEEEEIEEVEEGAGEALEVVGVVISIG